MNITIHVDEKEKITCFFILSAMFMFAKPFRISSDFLSLFFYSVYSHPHVCSIYSAYEQNDSGAMKQKTNNDTI